MDTYNRAMACNASPTDPSHCLHTGNESLPACKALCLASTHCDCISFTPHGASVKAKSTCKIFKGVDNLKQETHRDAYVRGSEGV